MPKIDNSYIRQFNNLTDVDTITFLDKCPIILQKNAKCPIINYEQQLVAIRDRASKLYQEWTKKGTSQAKYKRNNFSKNFLELILQISNLSPNLSHKLFSTSIKGDKDEATFMRQLFFSLGNLAKKCPIDQNFVEKCLINGLTQNSMQELFYKNGTISTTKQHALGNYGTKYVSQFLDTDTSDAVRKAKQRTLKKLISSSYMEKVGKCYYISCLEDFFFNVNITAHELIEDIAKQKKDLEDNLIEDSIRENITDLQKKNVLYIDLMHAQNVIDELRNFPSKTVEMWRKQLEIVGGAYVHGQYLNGGVKHMYYSYICMDCDEEYKANNNAAKLPKCLCGSFNYSSPKRKLVSADGMRTYSMKKFHCSPQIGISFKNLHVLGTDRFDDVFKNENQGTMVMLRCKIAGISKAMADYQGRTYYELNLRENQEAFIDEEVSEVKELIAEYYVPDSQVDKLRMVVGQHLLVAGIVRQKKPIKKTLTAGKHYLNVVEIEIDKTLTPNINDNHIATWKSDVTSSTSDALNKLVRSIEAKGVVGWPLLVKGVLLVYAHFPLDNQIRFHLAVCGDGGVGKSQIAKVMRQILPMNTRIAHGEASSDKLYGRYMGDSSGQKYFARGVICETQNSVIFIDESDKLDNLRALHTPMQDGCITIEKGSITNLTLPCNNNIVLISNPRDASFIVDERSAKEDLSLQKPRNLTDTIENRCVSTIYLYSNSRQYQDKLDEIGEYHIKDNTNNELGNEVYNAAELQSILLSSRSQKPKKYSGDYLKIKNAVKQLKIKVGRDYKTLEVCATAFAQLLHFTEVNYECYQLAFDFILNCQKTKYVHANGGVLHAN